MFMQLFLNDSFMIRKIIVAAVPAALVAVGMSLAISEPANACRRGCTPYFAGSNDLNIREGNGGAPNTTNNTNQVYPNNQSSGGGAFAGARSTNGSFTMLGSYGF